MMIYGMSSQASASRLWCSTVWLCTLLLTTAAVKFDPCSDITAITRGSEIVIGLVLWPGGLLNEWGNSGTGLNPCNAEVQANLTALGAMFATFNVKSDRLTVLKTSFPEELILTSRAPSTAPRVISLVAFRSNIRSDAVYAVSFDPTVTSGTGFVSSLSLMAKLELGVLTHLQFYNQTCNDCGGRTSTRCINSTSCALSFSECTCPDITTTTSNSNSSSSPANSSTAAQGMSETTTSSCNFGNFSFCATGVTLAFEGTDSNSAAFSTAAQVRKLNSYSLVSLYYVAKSTFFNVKDLFKDKTGEYWGKFGAVQQDIQDAYSGNAAANVDAASSGTL